MANHRNLDKLLIEVWLKRKGVVKLVSKFHLLEFHNAYWHITSCEMYYRKHIHLIAFKFNISLPI